MDWATILTGINTWAAGELTGYTVRWANQNPARPVYPFAVLNVISERQLGQDEQRYTYNSGTNMLDPTVSGLRAFMVSLQLHAKPSTLPTTSATDHAAHPRAKASNLRASLSKQAVLDALSIAGVAVIAAQNMQSLDREVEGEWIRIAQLDVEFAAAANVADSASSYIETVNSTGSFPPSNVTVTGPWGVGV